MSDDKKWQVNSLTLTLREPIAPGGTTRITVNYSGWIFGYREVMGYVSDRIGEDYTLLRPDALAYPMLAEPSSPASPPRTTASSPTNYKSQFRAARS